MKVNIFSYSKISLTVIKKLRESAELGPKDVIERDLPGSNMVVMFHLILMQPNILFEHLR